MYENSVVSSDMKEGGTNKRKEQTKSRICAMAEDHRINFPNNTIESYGKGNAAFPEPATTTGRSTNGKWTIPD